MGYKRWLFKHILREKKLVSIMVFFLIFFIATVSFTPMLIGDIFDELAKENSSFLEIIKTALLIALAGIIRTLADFTQSYTNEVIAHKVTKNVTEEFYDDMLKKSHEFHDRVRIGDIMARATYDTRQMNIFISPGLKFLLEGFFTILFSVSLMIYISPKLTLILVFALPFYIITIYDFNKKLQPISKAQVEQNSRLNEFLQESVTGIRIIRSFVKEDEEINYFDIQADKLREINTQRGILSTKYYPILITILVIAFSFLWGSFEVTKGSISLSQLVSFVMLAMTLNSPTWQLGWASTQFQIGMAAAKRIYNMKTRQEYVPEAINSIEWLEPKGEIVFENVSFSYNGNNTNEKTLDRIDLHVPAGSTIAIIGSPGSGKSTLIKLIMRFYDPTEGRITIDGIDLREMSLSSLRKNIGAIEQDIFLFSKTIRKNIAYGKPQASQEEIEHAAKLAQAHDFIMSFEEGYDTIVGERGVKLSGGQKQRIAIARALLGNPKILIFDDASSAIDAETEREIQIAIANVLKERTTFIITHRLATIKNADQIIILKKGKLVAHGTHIELIQSSIDYRRLFERFSELPPLKTGVKE
ncbi:MAG: ABC transporter ATP-binding protein [Candidatus Heimdallarchaeaceae archaeon]